MAFLARGIDQKRWYAAIGATADPLPADPLGDLKTTNDMLSVWEVPVNLSNLEDIVTGIAAKRQAIEAFDIAWIDEADVSALGVEIQTSPGDSLLAHVNGDHRHLVDLKAETLVAIADRIRHTQNFRDFSKREIGELMARAIRLGHLSVAQLKEKARTYLEKHDLA